MHPSNYPKKKVTPRRTSTNTTWEMRLEQVVENHEIISPPNGLLDFAMKERKERGEEREARGTQTREVGS